jgi:hypothetical protein
MTQEQLDKLEKARNLIFKVESEFHGDGKSYAAAALYEARVKINEAMSRG